MQKRILFTIITLFILFHSYGNNPSLPEKLYFSHNELYKKPNYAHNPYIIESKYDFSEVASIITKGCYNDYEKICAIYKWICDNISYDTHYKIYDADRCWDERKGVCQAYCNLFYHIAKSIDIRVEIIGGKSKDYNGSTGEEHGWIFAYTKKDYGILLDPTWGAGSVNGNTFTKNDDCWIWFNVSPEWMILSHFPNDNSYQLIDSHISYSKFLSLHPVNSLWIKYGMNANDIYNMVMKRGISLPIFYSGGEGKFQLIEFPLQESLKIGHTYTLRIKMLTNNAIGIANGNTVLYKNDEWNYEGNNIYSIEFIPRKEGTLSLCIHDHDSVWLNMIEYNIDDPTNEDWDLLKQHYPLDTPIACEVINLYEKEWRNAGIDAHHLLELIEKHNVKELPIIYTDMGTNFKIITIPMTKKLKKGHSYTFRIRPRTGNKWAIVYNNKWYYNWDVSDNDIHTMTITPEQSGSLTIYVQFNEGEQYHGCIGYDVK